MFNGGILQTSRLAWVERLSSSVNTDFGSCWLHYRVTCIFLLFWAMLLRATENFDQAIDCVQPDLGSFPNQRAINDVCRTSGLRTYLHQSVSSLTLANIMQPIGMKEVAYVDHDYFPWVSTLLLFQVSTSQVG